MNDNLADVAILANTLSRRTLNNKDINKYASLISKFSLMILKGEMTDNYNQLYYALCLPMLKNLDEDKESRNLIFKIKDLLMTDYERKRKANDALEYSIYQKMQYGR